MCLFDYAMFFVARIFFTVNRYFQFTKAPIVNNGQVKSVINNCKRRILLFYFYLFYFTTVNLLVISFTIFVVTLAFSLYSQVYQCKFFFFTLRRLVWPAEI